MTPAIPLHKITLFLGLFLAVSILVVLAIILDLWDGIHTAHVTRAPVRSHLLRKTTAKMTEYWRFIIIGFLIDCIGLIFDFYPIPFVALLFGTGLIIVEIKSMFEHSRRRKSSTARLPAIIHDIIHKLPEQDARRLIDHIIQFTPTDTTDTCNSPSHE